ncbi:hypothetical protein B0H17DRAFT_1191234 [Mycena rosella]|uniref:DUF6534 domain-containing protein n=1 Tax=Mycena rosella TaxID=1033263 RepID=A0AAD7GZU7_MYCRO|nr:hypothetical protein B0H17DRAFT_1191234 [Mycena rosella]
MEHVFGREVLTVDVSPVIGPLFIGNILNWMFMGTLVMQLYTYYITFPTDKLFLRILVNGLFLLDVAQTVTSTHYGWFFIVTTWGNPSNFDIIPWSASMIPLLCGIVSAAVQIFYAWRIWVLATNRFLKALSILIVVLAFTQGIAAVLSGALTELLKLHPEVSLWLSTSFTVDVIITASMTFILSRAKKNTVWSPTEAMLTKLIHRVVQTGAASATCAAVDLAMFVHFPATNFHFAPAYILGKLHEQSNVDAEFASSNGFRQQKWNKLNWNDFFQNG